jgi:hypothetical protein
VRLTQEQYRAKVDLRNQSAKAVTKYDITASTDANYQHLKYLFEGYRAAMLETHIYDGCPYSPGSARACSWWQGVELAKEDLQAHKIIVISYP